MSKRTNNKLKGAGDGLKTPIVNKPQERVQFPSARKFTAKLQVPNSSTELKLKKAIEELENRPLKRTRTVAEITPTKSRPYVGSRTKSTDDDASVMLHVTPRPFMSGLVASPSGRYDEERRLGLLVYQRMLLHTWRRSRARVAMLSESSRRHRVKIQQLDKQINCLKDLNQSECEKRTQAIKDSENTKHGLQRINETLLLEITSLQGQLNGAQALIQTLEKDLEQERNNINSKELNVNLLEDEINKIILEKNNQENTIILLKEKIELLKDTLQKREDDLKKSEGVSINFEELTKKYQLGMAKNKTIETDMLALISIKDDQQAIIKMLEYEIVRLNDSYALAIQHNEQLKKTVQELQVLRVVVWKNAKQFVLRTWSFLQQAAYLLFPAL